MTDEVPAIAEAPTGDEVPAVPVVPAEPNPAEAPTEKPVETEEDRERKRVAYDRRREKNLEKAIRREAHEKARADLIAVEVEKLKPKPPVDTGRPDLANYSDIEEFRAASEKYAVEKDRKEREATQQSERYKRETEAVTASWEEKADRAADKYDDFQAVVGELQPTTPWTAAIMRSANGEDVAYHLGKHPEEARAIIALHPVDQMLAIGALSAKLKAEPPKPMTPSNAPAPIKPVGGTAVTTKDPSEMSDAEFNKWRRSQIAQRR